MAEKMVSSFAERLRQCLDTFSNHTATSLAYEVGLSKQAISMYLAGTRKPKKPTVKVIAEILGVNEAWLMGYDVPIAHPSHANSNIQPAQDAPHRTDIHYKEEFRMFSGENAIRIPVITDPIPDEDYEFDIFNEDNVLFGKLTPVEDLAQGPKKDSKPNPHEYYWLDTHYIGSDDAFIRAADYVLVHRQEYAESEDIAVLTCSEDPNSAQICRVIIDEHSIILYGLLSYNAPRKYSRWGSACPKILGKVVQIQTSVK